MDSNSHVAHKTTTETKTEHFNLDDLDLEPTNRFTTRLPLPAWQHPRKPTINNIRPTKRATCHQTHTLLNDPTVVAQNQKAAKRDLEPSNQTTNGDGRNADLRRLQHRFP
jgi:hypothetical protein